MSASTLGDVNYQAVLRRNQAIGTAWQPLQHILTRCSRSGVRTAKAPFVGGQVVSHRGGSPSTPARAASSICSLQVLAASPLQTALDTSPEFPSPTYLSSNPRPRRPQLPCAPSPPFPSEVAETNPFYKSAFSPASIRITAMAFTQPPTSPPLEERPLKNTICLFDVDGTLTPARLVCPQLPLRLLGRANRTQQLENLND